MHFSSYCVWLTGLCMTCLQLIGDTGWKAFETQVESYKFKTSLFDTVVRSFYFFDATVRLLTKGILHLLSCKTSVFDTVVRSFYATTVRLLTDGILQL